MAEPALLNVSNLEAWYGESHVLHGVNFNVRRGEVVTLIGRNGAGKTTTLRSLMGVVGKRTGASTYKGTDLLKVPAHKIARLGIGYVPEERGIFSRLNVIENLMFPPAWHPEGMSVEEIYALFPNLKGRDSTQGTRLSGGEQQMLAIARVLRTGADFILLDEPTEGIAPVIIEEIGTALRVLKERGMTIILVEQNLRFAASVSDRHFVLDQGKVVDEISNTALDANMDRLNRYLGV
ncbi:ABC transporter ATP-binding protein [Rhizobium leguminosarum]|uniref:ABC transporter ATP-binding protein n=1 Tax=Rhizobium leguminosarum TaxID=384 RepID=UPI00098F1210|nr:ABC transporter ATP-binding protein [Rhizobium leguminosarum]ASS58064.1 ABC transporter ATP-binding protein [Rhizobium leguminosarum bv. viciae]MBB4329993.1 branched-chain amino acid transport system ATP-binding protein [Rhizobium leguminosarum]MBB4355388.1 branched-chain amino acid transport system ATP-binding protein [Rhizobium leguminosarum]MBB4389997.1 branched-chain amino acid transport system ATP-binding protein [Rhizobium leguminosarum]MBB4550496.1 branched-chain amino acid transport